MTAEYKGKLVDTHCHLDFPDFDSDREDVILRARENSIAFILNIGSSLENSFRCVALAKQYEMVYASVGCHPHEADRITPQGMSQLKELVKNEKVIAVGETGLDYFKNYSRPENQEPLFRAQLEIAREHDLPVVVHCRQAQKDVMRIMHEYMPLKAVIHCFSGDEDFLRECLESGFYISYTCNITYKKAEDLRRLVGITPLNRLMLETDAPFLSPEGFRGRRNEPFQIKLLAAEVSRLKKTNEEEIAEVTTANAVAFFKLT
ncbi:MAG: TatD family hydrolase [Candidatus Omnitrophica bacterium]|nr:TatD family hydrolase [Candidatus Omnitrophota bacterium]